MTQIVVCQVQMERNREKQIMQLEERTEEEQKEIIPAHICFLRPGEVKQELATVSLAQKDEEEDEY